MIKWISVEEKMPEENKTVLIYVPRYDFVTTGSYDGEEWTANNEEALYLITFWAEFNSPNNLME